MPKKEGINKTKTDNGLKYYQPVDGPTNRQLEFGLWWVEHRVMLKRILIGVLILIAAPLLIYGLYGFGYYFSIGITEDEKLANTLTTAPAIKHNAIAARSAQSLKTGNIVAFINANNTYDLATAIENPNANWYAKFNYYFTVGGKKSAVQREFILPGEKKYLISFLNAGSGASSATVKIENINWQRIFADDFKSIAEKIKTLADIAVTGIKFSAGESGNAGVALNSLQFNARNNSPYNFWEVDFYILAQTGGGLSGINKYRLEKMTSGEKRTVNIVWPANLSSAQMEIIPSVDIFDTDNYRKFDLGAGQEK
jgi:hypothetical protein